MPKVLHDVASRALQIHGSLGASDEMPFGAMVLESFHMGLADGATEVHQVTLARQILKEYRGTGDLFPTTHLLKLRAEAAAKFDDVPVRIDLIGLLLGEADQPDLAAALFLPNDYHGLYCGASRLARGGVMDVDAAVRGLLDREAIRETLYRYASTIDMKDWKGLREVFVEDAVITMVGGVRTEGAGAIVEYIERRCRKRVWQHHLLSVYEVVLDGDEARTLTYHTSHQSTEGKPEHVLQLVARYRDRLRREGDQWKIAEKHMELGWYEERLRAADGDLLQP
jgi:ketosteroid isomerase-like protein